MVTELKSMMMLQQFAEMEKEFLEKSYWFWLLILIQHFHEVMGKLHNYELLVNTKTNTSIKLIITTENIKL